MKSEATQQHSVSHDNKNLFYLLGTIFFATIISIIVLVGIYYTAKFASTKIKEGQENISRTTQSIQSYQSQKEAKSFLQDFLELNNEGGGEEAVKMLAFFPEGIKDYQWEKDIVYGRSKRALQFKQETGNTLYYVDTIRFHKEAPIIHGGSATFEPILEKARRKSYEVFIFTVKAHQIGGSSYIKKTEEYYIVVLKRENKYHIFDPHGNISPIN